MLQLFFTLGTTFGIKEGMNANNALHNTTRIAIPYYGTLCIPPSGLERVYFLADVDLGSKSVGSMILSVWNPKKYPDISRWLKQQGVAGVICSDSTTPSHVALDAEGLWIILQQDGEASELAECWARGEIRRGSQFRCGQPTNIWCSLHAGSEIEIAPRLKAPRPSAVSGGRRREWV